MSDQKKITFGTDPHKLHRRDSPDTSVASAHKVDTPKLERRVYDVICNFGRSGAISDEVRAAMPDVVCYSSVTARYKSLAEKGLIKYTGEKRKGLSGRGQRVMAKNEDRLNGTALTFAAYCGLCKAGSTMIKEAGQYAYCSVCKGVYSDY